jgi:hypothetical protein
MDEFQEREMPTSARGQTMLNRVERKCKYVCVCERAEEEEEEEQRSTAHRQIAAAEGQIHQLPVQLGKLRQCGQIRILIQFLLEFIRQGTAKEKRKTHHHHQKLTHLPPSSSSSSSSSSFANYRYAHLGNSGNGAARGGNRSAL